MHGQSRFLLGVVLVAAGAAIFAIAFRSSLSAAYSVLYGAGNVLEAIERLPFWLTIAVPCAGGLASGLLSQHRSARGQNVGNVMEAVALGRVRLSLKATAWRAAASWSAILTGMSIGREGPLIEFGGSLGEAVGSALRFPLDRLRILVAAGTAAGFAAAYNTPFGAVLFVLETMAGIAALDVLLPTMAAVVIATTLTRIVAGGGPIYGQRVFTILSPIELLSYAALGCLSAIAAIGFKRALALAEELVRRYPVPHPWRSAFGGLIVGLIAVFIPQVVGNGYEALNLLLDQRLTVSLLVVLVLAKVVATTSSVASGVPGGVFTPTLLLGGAIGALWGHGLQALGSWPVSSVGGYALVGMAAMVAATTHAPLTAAVMVFELSGDYPIVLPLLLATAMATSVSRWLGSESVYVAELRRRGIAWELTLDGRRIAE
jgi:CIC family chloride channel protein